VVVSELVPVGLQPASLVDAGCSLRLVPFVDRGLATQQWPHERGMTLRSERFAEIRALHRCVARGAVSQGSTDGVGEWGRPASDELFEVVCFHIHIAPGDATVAVGDELGLGFGCPCGGKDLDILVNR
jgi:hypothetical protein